MPALESQLQRYPLSHYPVLVPETQLFQIWQCENEQVHAQQTLRQLQRVWEVRQLRLLNFILHVPYEPPVVEHSKRHMLRSPHWDVVAKDSGTFILSGETQPLWPSESPLWETIFIHHVHHALLDLASLARFPSFLDGLRYQCSETAYSM